MGRYYNGDIEGKFWFAVQSSTDANFFGAEPYEPNYVNYHFEKDEHLEMVENGIKECEDVLGKNKKTLDKFFGDNNGYNDDMIVEQTNIKKENIGRLLKWYARLNLGIKIRDCLKEQGECNFEAEL
jgi:hypothetical protein